MADPRALSFAFLEAHPADAARVLEQLSPAAAGELLAEAPLRLSAPVVRQMMPLFAARAFDTLPDEAAPGLLRALGPQVSAAILRQMPTSKADQLLARLPTSTVVALRVLLGYPGNTVGAWADPQALPMPVELEAAAAIERLRESDCEHESIYVVDRELRLLGVVPLLALLRAKPQTPLRHLMQVSPPSLPAQAMLTAVQDHAAWAQHPTLPVVERGERFAGVLRHASLGLALQPEASPDVTPATGDAITMLAGGYWSAVSQLIGLFVAQLPAAENQREEQAGER